MALGANLRRPCGSVPISSGSGQQSGRLGSGAFTRGVSGVAAWAGFTLPSALVLTFFAMGISSYGEMIPSGALHGLKIVAVAVVAQAVWGMARSLCTDAMRVTIMVVATCAVLIFPTVLGQIAMIVVAALAGIALFKPEHVADHDPLPSMIRRRTGVLFLSVFVALLFWKLPSWLVVIGTGFAGYLFSFL